MHQKFVSVILRQHGTIFQWFHSECTKLLLKLSEKKHVFFWNKIENHPYFNFSVISLTKAKHVHESPRRKVQKTQQIFLMNNESVSFSIEILEKN